MSNLMNSWTGFELTGLIAALVALALYPVVMRLIANAVEPTRERLDQTGRELLASPYLSEGFKEIVDGMLDDAYSWRFMINAALKFPVYVIGRSLGIIRVVMPEFPTNEETIKKLSEFVSCCVRSAAAANPLFTLIFTLEVATLLIVLFPLGMLSKFSEFVQRFLFCTDRHRLGHT